MAHIDYNKNFYSENQGNSYRSALKIVPIINEVFSSNSVVDIGCGSGGWLKAFHENGSKKILGIDGKWVKKESLLIDPINFKAMDLPTKLGIEERFDLAISFEVAEHISEVSADKFIKEIVNLSDIVLFSAAIPYQGGTLHVNEQWQSYWAKKFIDFGYTPIDWIRHKIWSIDDVAFWYKQNMLSYVKNERLEAGDFDDLLPYAAAKTALDIIHPDLYMPKAKTVTNLNKHIPNVLKRILR